MTDTRYAWTGFYAEFADKLLAFRSNRRALIEKLQEVYDAIGMRLPKLDSETALADIDPFTVFGLFNKGITDANRRKVIAGLAEAFGVVAEQPDKFEGVPVLNNLNATFYAFSDDARRDEGDIDRLWDVFVSAVALGDEDSKTARMAFESAYDAAAKQFGLGRKLSMGLYWARPYAFLSLDSRNRWYIGDMARVGEACSAAMPGENSHSIPSGAEYLAICDIVRSHLGGDDCPQESFPALSYAAWLESERVNQEKREAAKEIVESALGDADVESVRYWLVAPGVEAVKWGEFYSEGIVGLGWSLIGDIESFDVKEDVVGALRDEYGENTYQKISAHALWQFCHVMKPGDIVYAKKGRSEIVGRGIVRSGYRFDSARGDKYKNVRSVEWTHKGSWICPSKAPIKTLTEITANIELVDKIEDLFEDEDGGAPKVVAPKYPSYSAEDFLSEVYMDRDCYDTLVGVLHSKKNIILEGSPGVGKTFAAKRLAYSLMGVKDASRVMMVQFHQSYSYEDFIEGYRPCADGFELSNGAFYKFCKRAADDEESDYFFIIDEINRGNLSKIFGELFMLIENDKRGQGNKLQLLYSHELFYVPSNVYLIGMMNTADRSLAMLDYALRRRFAFFKLVPAFASDGFCKYRRGLVSPKFDALVRVVESLNEAISNDESLGEGFCIGHSYFCGMEPGSVTDARLSAIVEYELIPMLKEYWFDEPAKVCEWSGRLRGALR